MGNQQLKTVAGVTEPKKDAASFPGMLKQFHAEIVRALPRHINADRMARIALTCFRQTPKLAECEPASVFAAVIQASQLGLEPGLNGRAFLIPYYNKTTKKHECQFVPGWKGLVELANRTGRASVWTGAVFDGDSLDYQLGDSPHVRHVPMGEDDPKKLTHTYSVGRIKGSEWPIVEVWPVVKIAKHRDRYNKVGDSHYSFREWEMYARKVPLLQVLKYLPASPELETAISLNDAAESGQSQGITIEGAIDNNYAPPASTNGADTPTYATVRQAIETAADVDVLDLAASLIAGQPEQFHAELQSIVNTRRAGFK